MMNETIKAAAWLAIPDDLDLSTVTVNELQRRVCETFLQRDNEMLDHIRMTAQQMGLGASGVQFALCSIPMGDDPDETTVERLHQQFHDEQQQQQQTAFHHIHVMAHQLLGTACEGDSCPGSGGP